MNSSHFKSALKRIGYGNAEKINPEQVSWIFDYGSTLPFLEWFCQNLGSSNVLNKDELRRFEELTSSGVDIVDGEQLESALSHLGLGEDHEDEDEEELNEDIALLEESIESMKRRLQKATQQKNRLSVQQMSLSHRLSKLGSLEGEVKTKLEESMEQSSAGNDKLNQALSNLKTTTSSLISTHKPELDETGIHEVFMSQVALDTYFLAENKFTLALTEYTSKQFISGIAELASCSEKSDYELLEFTDPASYLIKGRTKEVTEDDCTEMARLQSVYATSESKMIDACTEVHGIQAALQLARDQLSSSQLLQYPDNKHTLKTMLDDLQHELVKVRKSMMQLTTSRLPVLLADLADLQATRILRGDYDLKIARQDYFLSKQDQVISQLLLQRARHEFLFMILEKELQNHRNTHRLLSAVDTSLKRTLSSQTQRLREMSEPVLQPVNHARNTIGRRDTFISHLYNMLVTSPEEDDSEHSQLFITYSTLLEAAEKLYHQLETGKASMALGQCAQEDTIKQIEESLHSGEQLLYQASTTMSGLPQLSPQRLNDGLVQLEEILTNLDQSLRDVIKDCDNKKNILRSDSLKVLERDLFTCFFTDPSRLRRMIDELTNRIDTMERASS